MGTAIEVEGDSVEAALEEAAERLGVGVGDLDHEVVDEGKRGVLGIGARDVVVRAWARAGAGSPTDGAPGEAATEEEAAATPSAPARAAEAPTPTLSAKELDDLMDVALDATDEVLDGFDADADAEGYLDPEGNIVIEISGADVAGLIGRRGQTLEALQYLLSRIVSKAAGHRVRVLVDAEGYRARRREALEDLAQRTARKAAESRSAIALRPMSAAERRVIHLALAEDSAVATRSEGEDPDRKVIVEPR